MIGRKAVRMGVKCLVGLWVLGCGVNAEASPFDWIGRDGLPCGEPVAVRLAASAAQPAAWARWTGEGYTTSHGNVVPYGEVRPGGLVLDGSIDCMIDEVIWPWQAGEFSAPVVYGLGGFFAGIVLAVFFVCLRGVFKPFVGLAS